MELDNNLAKPVPPAKKTGKKGGPRKNSGRPKGTHNKISGSTIIEALQDNLGVPYEYQLAQNYLKCIIDNDKPMIAKYDHLFLNKVVADKAEMDITSNGKSVVIGFTFPSKELDDWNDTED